MTIDRERLKAAKPQLTAHQFRGGPLVGETFYVRRMSAREHGQWLTQLVGMPEEQHVSQGGLLRVAMSWCDDSGVLLFDAGSTEDMDELRSLDYAVVSEVESAVNADAGAHMQVVAEAKKN